MCVCERAQARVSRGEMQITVGLSARFPPCTWCRGLDFFSSFFLITSTAKNKKIRNKKKRYLKVIVKSRQKKVTP